MMVLPHNGRKYAAINYQAPEDDLLSWYRGGKSASISLYNTPFKRNINLHLYSSCFKVTVWWMFKLFIYFSFVHLWVV